MKLYVEKFLSKKNTVYTVLKIDLGYAKHILSWDRNLCAEILEITVSKLMSLENGIYEINLKGGN